MQALGAVDASPRVHDPLHPRAIGPMAQVPTTCVESSTWFALDPVPQPLPRRSIARHRPRAAGAGSRAGPRRSTARQGSHQPIRSTSGTPRSRPGGSILGGRRIGGAKPNGASRARLEEHRLHWRRPGGLRAGRRPTASGRGGSSLDARGTGGTRRSRAGSAASRNGALGRRGSASTPGWSARFSPTPGNASRTGAPTAR